MIPLTIINESDSTSSTLGGCKGCKDVSNDPDDELKVQSLLRELQHAVEETQKVRQRPATRIIEQEAPRDEACSVEFLSATDSVMSYRLATDRPLPLVSELSHRIVEDKHLWIGVQDAVVVVLNAEDSAILEGLAQGKSPSAQTKNPVFCGDDVGAWDRICKLIAKLAAAGFIRGVEGDHERRAAEPHRFARFHLTKACQLECIHCYADSSPYEDRSQELPSSRWERLADDFAANGGERVLLTGGEALLHRGCVDLMRRSKKARLHVTLFSNGLLVPRFIDAIQEYANQVQISLDGPDAATNDQIRGTGTYKKILRAIDLLLERGVAVRIGMSVMEKNWDSWKRDFLAFASRYSGTRVEYRLGFGITHYGRGATLSDTLDMNRTQTTVQHLLNEVGAGHDGPMITRHTSGCGYGEQLVVGPDGTVYPCHLLDGPTGHIDESSVGELTAMLQDVARLFDVDHVEGCQVCDIRHLCGGTCRVMNGQRTGTRLKTTCTDQDKQRRIRNLVTTYSTD